MLGNKYLFLCLFGILVYFITATVAIIGGQYAGIFQFPYQVSIQILQRRHICGGGIIGDEHVLTAAHCVLHENGTFHRMNLSILAGTNDLHRIETPAVRIVVEKIYIPCEYSPIFPHCKGDIAVLKLRNSLYLGHHPIHMRKLELPSPKYGDQINRTAEIAGFGWDHLNLYNNRLTGGNRDTSLRFQQTRVLGNYECTLNYYPHLPITDKHFCAQARNQHDGIVRGVCVGDIGGPLIQGETVIGILIIHPQHCREERQPGIYTRVSRYLRFIGDAMNDRAFAYMRTYP